MSSTVAPRWPSVAPRLLRSLGLALCVVACAGVSDPPRAAPPRPADAGAFSFALMGDMPYSRPEITKVDRLVDDINRHRELAFTVHIGDLKGGGESCRDGLLRERLAQLQRLEQPLVYTPGDNEWTDCHRRAAGRFEPIERLAALRALYYAQPAQSLGQRRMPLRTQAAQPGFERYVENAMWSQGGVVFATVHVVGSNNDLDPWSGLDATDSLAAPRADRMAEFRAREAAVLAWLDAAFARARQEHAAGVLIAMQANPRFDLPPGDPERRGFDAFIDALVRHATAFGKPVALAHGDTHRQRVDRPLQIASAPGAEPLSIGNLVRVEAFGSPHIHWVEVTVDASDPQVFRFERRLVAANVLGE